MSKQETGDKLSVEEWHKKQAVDYFNQTWDLMDKQERTREEDMKMIHMAHASRFHWGEIGTPLQFARGEWQVSRVYGLLGMAESALYHAQYSLDLCVEHSIGDFDLAFAYEAMARAHMAGNNKEQMLHYVELGREVAKQIAKDGDRDYFLSELNAITLE